MPVPAILDLDVDSEEGIIQSTLQQFMFVEGRKVIVLGDPIPEHDGVMSEGSPFFFINGLPACRAGDATSCEHVAVPSEFWWLIS